jgi:hypothetical protein
MATDLARKAAEIANADVGGREDLGPNDSARIRQYWRTFGIIPGRGLPYCAIAVSSWIKWASQAIRWPQTEFKSSSRALGLVETNGDLSFLPEALQPDMLPCVGVIDHGGGKGHAFLIVGMDDQSGSTLGTKLQTIEANTNYGGSRDGGGTMALNIRTIADLYRCVEIR